VVAILCDDAWLLFLVYLHCVMHTQIHVHTRTHTHTHKQVCTNAAHTNVKASTHTLTHSHIKTHTFSVSSGFKLNGTHQICLRKTGSRVEGVLLDGLSLYAVEVEFLHTHRCVIWLIAS